MRKYSFPVALVALAFALSACGGGGSSSFATVGSSSGASSGTSSSTSSGSTTATTYEMGNGSGSDFHSGVISLPTTSLSAGGTASLSVTIVDKDGTLYTAAPVTVTFNSACIAKGQAVIAASAPSTAGTVADTIVTTSGNATASYTAKGCSPSDVITATATVGTQSLTATGTLAIASATVGSIQFVSATPSTIGLRGTGLNETSTVVFKVLDSTGGPKPGVSVAFALSTTVGGITLSPTPAVSGADGTVQTVVSSGTAHTTVTVTATIASPAISTQSSVLAVSTGLPASKSFSIATTGCPNIEGFNIDGIVVPIVVRLSDRYQNPAPDGTAVAFTTDGGQVGGNCVTSGGTGSCSVDWTSSNPRPSPSSDPPSLRPGRAVILATAIGEESFTDIDGSGFYVSSDPFSNLGEPYRDDNENGMYDLGEYFLDFTHTGVYVPPDGSGNPASPPVGTFRGITCVTTGTGPSTVATSCTSTPWAIGAQVKIIMAEGSPGAVMPANGTTLATLTQGGTATYSFLFQDSHLNPLPGGTTISAAVIGTGLNVNAPSSFTVPCTTDPTTYAFSVSASATATSGSLTVTVTSPGGAGTGGLVTTLSYPIPVTP
jgi:hypothetical protein